MPIKAVEIAGVRGIRRRIELPLAGKSFVIHGENGTGKSSIVQALSWALRGETPPTPDAAYSSEESFRTHVLEDRQSPRVKISLTDGGEIEVDSTGLRASGSGSLFRSAAIAASPILTRNKLLAVVSDKPADRYRYLESFLDLEQADTIRDTILAKSTEHQNQARQKADRIRYLLQPITIGPTVKAERFENVAASLGQWASQLGLAQALPSWDQTVEAAKQAAAAASPSDLNKERALLQGAVSLLDSLASESPVELPDLDLLAAKRAQLVAGITDARLADFLALAHQHLGHAAVTKCPLCDQPVDHQVLLASVTARLEQLSELRSVSEDLKDAGRKWQAWWRAFIRALTGVLPALGVAKVSDVPGMPEAFGGARLLHEKKDAPADDFLEALIAAGYQPAQQWVLLANRLLREAVAGRLAALPAPLAGAQFESFATAVSKASAVRGQVLQLERETDAATKRATALQRLGEALRLARQDVAQRLLATISQTVANYYSRIHPPSDSAEVTDAPVIEVQRHRDGTAFVRGQFNGRRIADPKWAYSDGHQDTIGLCIFLALRKFRSRLPTDCRLMVLDDVVLSIDLPHTTRVARLLREDFSDHQILFLTHNKLVADLWKDPIPSSQRIEITRWTIEDGPDLGQYTLARKALVDAIGAGSAADIGQRILGLMEEWVCQCRFAYELSVPAKRGERYTLGDIWPKFVKTSTDIQKRLKTPIGSLGRLLEDLKDLPSLRNNLWGHFNEAGQQYPVSAAREYGCRAVELFDTLYCLACESFALPLPDGDKPLVVACQCGKLKYERSPSPVPGEEGITTPA